jgi:hypothetical protein
VLFSIRATVGNLKEASMKEFVAGYWRFVMGNPRRTAYVLVGFPLALLWLWLVDVHSVIFDPVQTVGIVMATQCAGRAQTFDYRYQVSDNAYVGRGQAKILPDGCGDTWNGSTVDVTYLRGYPSVSVGGSMRAWWSDLAWRMALGVTVVGPFYLLLMFLGGRFGKKPA